MKKISLLLVLISASIAGFSQNDSAKTKQKEIGLLFNNFNNYGATFKMGTNNMMWRFNSLLGSNGLDETNSESQNRQSKTSNIGFRVGFELRKKIKPNFELRYGVDASYDYSSSSRVYEVTNEDITQTTSSDSKYHSPGVNLVLGANYIFKDNIVLGAEFLPSYKINMGSSTTKTEMTDQETTERTTDLTGYDFGLNSSSVILSIAYRF